MAKSPKIPPVLTGVAGEYFVAAELSRRGYIASISLRNTRGIDILATNQDGSRSVTIQCKTSQKTRKRWVLSDKSEALGIALLSAIESDDPSALVGLPLIRTCEMLRLAGVDPLAPA
jgi:hypothetical protein